MNIVCLNFRYLATAPFPFSSATGRDWRGEPLVVVERQRVAGGGRKLRSGFDLLAQPGSFSLGFGGVPAGKICFGGSGRAPLFAGHLSLIGLLLRK